MPPRIHELRRNKQDGRLTEVTLALGTMALAAAVAISR